MHSVQLTWLVSCHCVLYTTFVSPDSSLSLWSSGGCYIGMGAFGKGHIKGGCELVGQVIGQLLRKHTFRVLCNLSLRHGEIDRCGGRGETAPAEALLTA